MNSSVTVIVESNEKATNGSKSNSLSLSLPLLTELCVPASNSQHKKQQQKWDFDQNELIYKNEASTNVVDDGMKTKPLADHVGRLMSLQLR